MTCSIFSTCSSPGCSLTRSAKAEKRGCAACATSRRAAALTLSKACALVLDGTVNDSE